MIWRWVVSADVFEGRDGGRGEEERQRKGRRGKTGEREGGKLTPSKSRSSQGSSIFDSTLCILGRFHQLKYLV